MDFVNYFCVFSFNKIVIQVAESGHRQSGKGFYSDCYYSIELQPDTHY